MTLKHGLVEIATVAHKGAFVAYVLGASNYAARATTKSDAVRRLTALIDAGTRLGEVPDAWAA